MSHTIELRKASKYYAGEDTVSMGFSRIDLDLDIGEFVAITGESGSGKSTLLNVISGLDTYEEGEMFVCGEDTTAFGTEDYERYRKTYIGNIFQDFNLINSYTVYQNIETVMLLNGKKRSECRERILELIDLVGLGEYRKTKVSRLSGGQKQRVAIARALAKDAPVIVADEPTGNLDSASAAAVMEILSRVSKDKLVVIVTHNYDQAEPYVTRKLTMHDGRIIEDKSVIHSVSCGGTTGEDKTTEEPAGPAADTKSSGGEDHNESETGLPDEVRKMGKGSEILLGIRNTFNIPAKFILLFIVYIFVSTAVLGQYATTKNSMHERDLLGTNPYFNNISADRIIVKKADESAFTDQDFALIESNPNIRSIVKNDAAIDAGVSILFDDYMTEGAVYPVSLADGTGLTYGHMPEGDYEAVIRIDTSSDLYITFLQNGEKFIDTELLLYDAGGSHQYDFGHPVTIAGIIINDDPDKEDDYALYGYSTVYMSDNACREILVSMMANSSSAEFSFDGTRVKSEYDKAIYSSADVPEGEAYIFENEAYYYTGDDEDATAEGKPLGITVRSRFFESKADLTVGKVLTEKNIQDLIGVPADDYNAYYNCVFISEEDFNKLFDRGYYQISAFMINETDSDETLAALGEAGFTTLAVKDSLTDMTGGFNLVIELMTYGRLLAEFLILFFIAYAVIRIIMRSRNPYYSTLRILGATKRNTDAILRVELILMMAIAYAVDMCVVAAFKYDVIRNETVLRLLHFLTTTDYVLLGIVLLVMSLLIANRYSRKIFTRSAMKAFREEV